MAFQLTLKLKSTANPHLYVDQIRQLMKDDISLHPLMKNTLLLLKKTRLPYLRLASIKDIIFIPEDYTHLERAVEPQLTGWERILWSEEEKEEYNTNPKKFFSDILNMYVSLGYELVERKDITDSERDELLKITENAKNAQENVMDKE
jgi:hypothetical protein